MLSIGNARPARFWLYTGTEDASLSTNVVGGTKKLNVMVARKCFYWLLASMSKQTANVSVVAIAKDGGKAMFDVLVTEGVACYERDDCDGCETEGQER